MSTSSSIDMELVRHWAAGKCSSDSIQQQLNERGIEDVLAQQYMAAYKKIQHTGRLWKAFLFAGSGALLGFISCLLTVLNPFPELYNLILFGLTSVAITLICAGLYFLFEG